MSGNCEHAKTKSLSHLQGKPVTLKKMWSFYKEHYGMVLSHLALLGTAIPIWVIWSYLEKIEGKDLFIPSMSDPGVFPMILFAAIIFFFGTLILLGYGVLAAFLAVRAWQTKTGSQRVVDVSFLGGMGLLISVLTTLLYVEKPVQLDWIFAGELIAAILIYWVIVISAVYPLLKLFPQRNKLLVQWVGVFALMAFFVASRSVVAEHITRFAGISQKESSKQYYLVDKRYVHHFQKVDEWELVINDEKISVRGYKLFHLSDVTILCPAISESAQIKVKQCARIQSADLMVMPENYIPVSKTVGSGEAGKNRKALTAKK